MQTPPPSVPPVSPAPTPPPPKGHTGRNVAVVVAVIIALVVAGLYATGHLPFGPGSSGSSSTATSSYSLAATSGASVANAASGGPWTLLLAEGLDVTSSYTNRTPGGSGCTLTGGSGTLSFAAYGGNYSNGQLSNWYLIYVNAGATSALAVVVSGGHASELGVGQGSSCLANLSLIKAESGTVLDSTQIASTLLATSEVDSFTEKYATANAQYVLVTTVAGGSQWLVTYSGCPIAGYGGGGSTGASVIADVNASTGAILTESSFPSDSACPGHTSTQGTPIGSAFAVGNPVLSTCPAGHTFASNGCLTGDYTYTLTIESSAVFFGNVTFEVTDSEGFANIPGAQGFALLNITGAVAAEASPVGPALFMTGWSFPATSHETNSTPLTTLYTIVIDVGASNPAGLGYAFVADGVGAYFGTTNPLSLPLAGCALRLLLVHCGATPRAQRCAPRALGERRSFAAGLRARFSNNANVDVGPEATDFERRTLVFEAL